MIGVMGMGSWLALYSTEYAGVRVLLQLGFALL